MDSNRWWEAFRAGNPDLELPEADCVIEATLGSDVGGMTLTVHCLNRGQLPPGVSEYTIRVHRRWDEEPFGWVVAG